MPTCCHLVTDLLATRRTILTCQDSLPCRQQVRNKLATSLLCRCNGIWEKTRHNRHIRDTRDFCTRQLVADLLRPVHTGNKLLPKTATNCCQWPVWTGLYGFATGSYEETGVMDFEQTCYAGKSPTCRLCCGLADLLRTYGVMDFSRVKT